MTLRKNFFRDQSGLSAFMTAICLFALLGSLGLVIDLGHYYTVHQELKNAADAAALAGVRALFPYDLNSATPPLSPNCTEAVAVATSTARSNSVDNAVTIVAEAQAGRWQQVNAQFVGPWCTNDSANFTNAVRVTTRRQEVPLIIMQVLGVTPRTLQATSIAVMSWAGNLRPGGAFPMAIAKKYAAKDQYVKIYLNDDNNDVGCWFLKGESSPGGGTSAITDLLSNPANMPCLKNGDFIYMFNGVVTPATNIIDQSYVGKTVWLPVVETVKFNQSTTVKGFAAFKIQDVGKDNGKHYVGGTSKRLALVPTGLVDNSGEDFGLLAGARLVN